MNLRMICATALTIASVPACRPVRLGAQTHDEAHLIVGISAGWIGEERLWHIPDQAIASSFESVRDTFNLVRTVRSNISISGHVTFYPHPRIGFTGQFTYLGLGTTDGCSVAYDAGDAELVQACKALSSSNRSASTVAVQGGVVVRPLPRAGAQPYFEGLVGLAFTPTSTVETRSIFGAIGDTTLNLTIYNDTHWGQIRPSWTAAFGIATAPSQGYQLRVEFRETWMALTAVTQATTGQGYEPGQDPGGKGAERSVIKGFPSILVGFDVVLTRQPGRRY
ncbi:MAG: hypothetical protein ACREL5_00160 [Gemmatimonadales bacterium]